MSEQTKHTPTPFAPVECPGTDGGAHVICRKDAARKRRTLAHAYDADFAALIVRAVNSHAALVEALEAMHAHFSARATGKAMPDDAPSNWDIFEKSRAALKLARGEA